MMRNWLSQKKRDSDNNHELESSPSSQESFESTQIAMDPGAHSCHSTASNSEDMVIGHLRQLFSGPIEVLQTHFRCRW